MMSSALEADLEPSMAFSERPDERHIGRENLPVLEHEESLLFIPPHPLGVKPLGNQYTASSNARFSIGKFQLLPDEALILLLEYLDSPSLRILGSTCKALFAFCYSDELWKALFLQRLTNPDYELIWRGSWRATYLDLSHDQQAHVTCESLFSDVLYRPFQCTNTPLAPYTTRIPSKNAIPRLEDMTPTEFADNWSDRPFILTKPVREWPVYLAWDTDKLLEQFSNVKFRAEAVDWSLKSYVDYMNNSFDESPLYLFDRSFVEKMGLVIGRNASNVSYWIPECFGEDLFAVLGDRRPDSRWLIIGPERSGSTFHKDPNATSAWNAVLRGSKYWIMFPTVTGSQPPPGVYVSDDQSEVTSPLSIAEWLIGFHAEARQTPGCLEGICGEGEVLHVPSGWWHLVVNLDSSIAITHNFVPRSHLSSVLSFLKDKPDQVSGFKKDVSDPYGTFATRMEAEYPDLLSRALLENYKKAEGQKRKWDEAVGADIGVDFSFGFGDDADSDEDIP